MNTKDFIFIALLLLVLGYAHFSRPKLAYVRSEILVNEFAGMQEARREFQGKQQEWQANLDTLRADYQRQSNAGAAPEELNRIAGNIQLYAQRTEQMAAEEDQAMTQAILEQINTFVEQYGQEQGYDLIIGTTQSGNLLYGKEKLDITEALVKALNYHYNPAVYEE